jgi:photosystem II stability/assembly factor-like uncharacterized protein
MTHENSIPESGSVPDMAYALALSPNFATDGLCFVARRSGLYRSTDGGQTWQNAYATLSLAAPLGTLSVALSSETGETLHVYAGVSGGILHSTDAARPEAPLWQISTLPTPPPLVSALALSPHYAVQGTVLAATVEDGVFRSGDRGTKWESWNFGLLDLDVYALALSPAFGGPPDADGSSVGGDETAFVGTESGIFRSTNGGRAWRETPFDPDLAPVLCLALSPNYAQDGCLYAGTAEHGLYRSTDRGESWSRVGASVPPLAGTPAPSINALLLSPGPGAQGLAEPQILAMLADTLLVSRDGGTSWEAWAVGLDLSPGATCVAAPLGLAPGAPLLVGLGDGRVLKV